MNLSISNRKKPKVTLIVPNFRWSNWDVNTLWHFIPYNLCLLAAMIEKTCEVSVLDANKENMTEDGFKSELKKLNPDIVGITVLMDQYAPAGHKAAELVKSVRGDITVIMGGVYVTMNPENAMNDRNIDFVVIGEGEYALKELVGYFKKENPLPKKGICYRLNEKVVNTGHSDFIQDLDALPLPAYHLLDYEKYIYGATRKSVDGPPEYPYSHIVSSRGCPIGCSFCQTEYILGKKYRPRSPENVLNEIRYLKNTYGIKSLIFYDDNLFIDKKRAKAIFQGMINEGLAMPWTSPGTAVFMLDEELIKLMRKSGCRYIDLAIESGCERVLEKIIGKPVNHGYAKEMIRLAKKENIYVAANFIVGFPTETWSEIRQTIKFAEDIDVDYVKLFTAIPLRNTKLWKLCEKEKAFKKGFKESDVRWNIGQVETDEFSADDLTFLRAYEWDRINFTNPKKRARTAEMMGITENELSEIRRRTLEEARRLIKTK